MAQEQINQEEEPQVLVLKTLNNQAEKFFNLGNADVVAKLSIIAIDEGEKYLKEHKEGLVTLNYPEQVTSELSRTFSNVATLNKALGREQKAVEFEQTAKFYEKTSVFFELSKQVDQGLEPTGSLFDKAGEIENQIEEIDKGLEMG